MKLQIEKKDKKGITQTIKSVQEWRTYAPPQNPDKQWVSGKSAKTLAEYVFKDNQQVFKKGIEQLVSSIGKEVPDVFKCEPEAKTPFPKEWGTRGVRSHDLKMVGDNRLLVCIEAKADEPFGSKISTKRNAAKKNADKGKNMNLRLDGILNFLYPNGIPSNSEDLMYQLLSATVGTIIEAKENGIRNAISLFIVFKTNETSNSRIRSNNKHFKVFCKSLGLDAEGGLVSIDGVNCWIKKINVTIND